MKKVLSFVLVLAMILGSFAMVNAASFTDVTTDDDFAPAVAVLSDLGIVNGYPDGTFGAEKVVTRAEMAKFIIEALGITPAQNKGTSFPDVPYTHWAAPYVDYCQSLGIITGYGDGTFKPDQTVTYNEAIKMVVCALGYNADALSGTYPANFVNMAMALGLLDDIQAGTAGAVRGDIAQLVYAAMGSDMVTVSKNGEVTKIQNANGVKVTMFDRHGVRYSGVKGQIITEGDVNDAVIDISKYLGALCTYWTNKDGEIVAIEEELSTFYTFTASKNGNWGDYELKKNSVTSGAAIFMNGEYAGINTETPFPTQKNFEYTIAADYSGVYITQLYSVSYWEVAKNGVIYIDDEDALEELLDGIEDDDKLDSFKFRTNKQAEIDTDEFELVGIDTLDDFAVGDVVEVYDGTDGKIVKIVVTRNVVTGKITKMNSKEDEITVAGTAYDLALLDGYGFVTPSVGSTEYNFYLNAAGEVVAYETVKNNNNYAIIVATGTKNGQMTDVDGEKIVKLFTEEGKTVTYPVSNSKNFINEEWFSSEGSEYLGVLVTYTVNTNGEAKITLVDKKDEINAAKIKAVGAKKTIDGYYFASDATVIVSGTKLKNKEVEDLDGEFDLTLSSAEKIAEEKFDDCLYILNKNGQIVFAIVDLRAENSTFGIYAGYATVADEDNVAVKELYFYVNGEKVAYVAKNNSVDGISDLETVNGALGEIKMVNEKVTTFAAINDFTGTEAKQVEATAEEPIAPVKVRNNMWGKYSLADDVKVYVVTGTTKVELKDVSKLNVKDIKSVTLYDLDDEEFGGERYDSVYDIVVIQM